MKFPCAIGVVLTLLLPMVVGTAIGAEIVVDQEKRQLADRFVAMWDLNIKFAGGTEAANEEAEAFLRKNFLEKRLRVELSRLVQNDMSAPEIKSMIAVYETDAGKSWMRKLGKIFEEANTITQDYFAFSVKCTPKANRPKMFQEYREFSSSEKQVYCGTNYE